MSHRYPSRPSATFASTQRRHPQTVPPVTPSVSGPTYTVMEQTDNALNSLSTEWRADIDSVPFAHEPACHAVAHALRDTPECPTEQGSEYNCMQYEAALAWTADGHAP